MTKGWSGDLKTLNVLYFDLFCQRENTQEEHAE